MTSSFTATFWNATSAAVANNMTTATNALKNATTANYLVGNKFVNNNNGCCPNNKFEDWTKMPSNVKITKIGDEERRHSQRARPPPKLIQTDALQSPTYCPASCSAAISPGAITIGHAVSTQVSPNLLVPRPLRRCRSASPGASLKVPLLSAEQQNLIKKSWQKVSKSAIGKTIYIQMTEKCPNTKNLFLNDFSAIGRHERYFVDLIQSTVDNLTDMEIALRPWLETIGEGHSGFAMKQCHWDAFGESLVSALSAWVGRGKAHRETVRAWRLLFSFIADRLGSAPLTRNGFRSTMCTTPRIQLLTLVSNGPKTPP